MEATLTELLAGKATVIKTKDYLSTKEFVQPFLDEMSKITTDFRIQVKLPDQMTVSEGLHNVTYNRVLVQAVLPKENSIDGHDEVIGLLYGLDVRKPVAKIYRGYLNQACTNLTVFNSQWMNIQEIKPREGIVLAAKALLEATSDFELKMNRLKQTFLGDKEVYERLGKWVDTCLRDSYYNGIQNVRISPNLPIEGYKSLFIDDESPYYVPQSREASMFEVYNAFTQVITDDDKDFVNQFEKTMMVNKLLNI